ncbi:MAG: hypothetical protein HKM87_06140 [Ignavibacteriaceae bacterium]|nr:hypothetical protein [Ignavibacteriaceae bacterium]
MKKANITLLALIIFILLSCNVEDIVTEIGNEKITAKEKIGAVINTAKSNFATDAELSAIYGREVDSEGKVDLLNTNSVNAFVYIVQSDSLQSNEFYVPVIGSDPVKSPINFNTMLSFIKNNTAKNILESVFGTLATVSISASAVYDDSPQVMSQMLSRSDVTSFRSSNPESKIDMFLLPGKSLDTNFVNTADWIVNFYDDSSSLVLWLHPGNSSGTIDLLSN